MVIYEKRTDLPSDCSQVVVKRKGREFKPRKFMTHYESCVGAPMIFSTKVSELRGLKDFFRVIVKLPIQGVPTHQAVV